MQHRMQNVLSYVGLLAEEQVQQEKQQCKQFHLTIFTWASTQKSLDKLLVLVEILKLRARLPRFHYSYAERVVAMLKQSWKPASKY